MSNGFLIFMPIDIFSKVFFIITDMDIKGFSPLKRVEISQPMDFKERKIDLQPGSDSARRPVMIGLIQDVKTPNIIDIHCNENGRQKNTVDRKSKPHRTKTLEVGNKLTRKNEIEKGKVIYKVYNNHGDLLYRVPSVIINKDI